MDKYFSSIDLLQNTLLPYFCEAEPLKSINKKFYELNYKKYNIHLQPHGIINNSCVNYYRVNEIKTYKNGKLNGLYEIWYDDKLHERKNYKNEKLNGLFERWYNNGQLQDMIIYKDGKKNGLSIEWNDDGKLFMKKNYKNGELDCSYKEWYECGELVNIKMKIMNI
jgi:antitoxin component YwqK of YwqJK toxin-antitoxin module